MKISTKGRYAVRLMLDLAMHNTGEAVSIKIYQSVKGYLTSILSRLFLFLTKQDMCEA